MLSMEKTATGLIKKPIFSSSPCSLQEIACSYCALNCWRASYFLLCDQYPDETAGIDWFISVKHVSSGDYFKLPRTIEKLIDYRMKWMGNMLYTWAQKSFGDSCRAAILNFDSIILNARGGISYKLTAKNLLSSDLLNPVEKYRIACSCSFEDDVKRLWPSVKNDETVQGCSFEELPTMYYWNCRMKNELHKIPGDERYSAESRMLSSYLCDWSEIEYFWNNLSSKEQISKITDTKAGLVYINENVLRNLDYGQLNYILCNLPVAVVHNLAIEGDGNTRFAERAWNCVERVINGDQFYELLYNLCMFAFSGESSDVNHVAVFLYEMWISASDNLQKCVLDYPRRIESFFDDIEEGQLIQSYGYDMSFLLAVFIGAKFQLRRELWHRNWHKLVVLARPSDLGRFLELSFQNACSLVEFRETEMMDYSTLNYEFDSFIKQGLCSELVDYLQFCSSDKERVRHLRMQIVNSNVRYTSYYFDPDMVLKFNDFIDDTFECTSLASQYKENFVLDNIDEWYEMVDSGWLTNVKYTIQCLLSEGRLLSHVKRALYDHWQYNLRIGTIAPFYIRHWYEFSNWCAPNEEMVLQSKDSLNLDYLLGVLLPECIRKEWVLPPYFSRLDRFLRWYFVSEEATNEFKLQRIKNYKQVPVIKKILEKGNDRDISRMLNWFFNFDADKIEEFRSKFII